MTARNRLLAVLGAAVVIAGVVAAGFYMRSWLEGPLAGDGASPDRPFALTRADGVAVTDKTYRGKWLLVYFGYTYCPDACPTALNAIAEAMEKLGPEAANVQPLFVTVDPERDTPEVMGQYVKSFDPRIVGLTGTDGQIAAVAKEYQVYYKRRDVEGGTYLMDHTSLIYVVDPAGKLVRFFGGGSSGERIAQHLRELMSQTS
ncbi:MAG TPA: SCO family protein [Stellaceae bacterium]|nr:SCO family protein [Stellaceae bacterium]